MENLKLPENLFNEYFEKSKNCVFCEIPLSEFSKDELIAITAFVCDQIEIAKKDYDRQISFMQQLDRMKRNVIDLGL